MSEILQELIGTRVRIYTAAPSGNSYTDEGVLEAFDYHWLRLRNEFGERLVFPIYNIRLVKPAGKAAASPKVNEERSF